MAETYKGLTIRIGAETTSLQRALRSADSAISRTQTQLRKMSQALRMDPQSTKAINTQLDLMGNKAVETQRKVIQLRNSIQQISNQKIELYDGSKTDRSIRDILNGTQDISRSAAEAADNYNTINSQIEQLYRTINKAARANKEFSDAFGEKYDIRDFKTGSGVKRFRCWDSCMYSDFTLMASGNPRTSQLERFRQRFMHKLVYFPANNDGIYGCVGCGRCLSKCPISMNIVKVAKCLEGEL